jgi:hypothetical protein
MWIGASPSSTGGGIKTTTATLALLNIYAIASGRNKIELFYRRISELAITRAFSTALLSLLYIATALFALLITEQEKDFSFEAMLFEVVSAVSTVGLSTGITPQLSDAGKISYHSFNADWARGIFNRRYRTDAPTRRSRLRLRRRICFSLITFSNNETHVCTFFNAYACVQYGATR